MYKSYAGCAAAAAAVSQRSSLQINPIYFPLRLGLGSVGPSVDRCRARAGQIREKVLQTRRGSVVDEGVVTWSFDADQWECRVGGNSFLYVGLIAIFCRSRISIGNQQFFFTKYVMIYLWCFACIPSLHF